MSDLRIGAGVFFERGIDSVTYKSGDASQGLPDPRLLPPTDNALRPQLDALLARPNSETYLMDSIRPDLPNRELLLPVRFRQTMDSALGSLRDAATQHQQDGDTKGTQTLNRAVRLLTEDVALRDLLQMYRSALYQG